jgi:adenosylmethionine-8-amino-7-oxononanoate aminotransferase
MVAVTDSEALRRSSLKYLWMHNRDWTQMAEDGEPRIMVGGEGVRVTDSEGKTWIDVNGGYNSVNVGYGRTEIADAAYEQMVKLPYFPQGTTTAPTVMFAEKLAQITPGSLERTWPVSGGSEANETALKIARSYHKRRGETGRYKVISRKGSYHGMTGGVLWLGGAGRAAREDFEPAYPGMVYAPQPLPYRCELGGASPSECAVRCAQAIEDLILFHGPKTVAAVVAEPVSAASAAAVPGDEYWPMLREICDRYGVLLVADEIVTGFGQMGRMFALEHWGVVPDIMAVAKGLISTYLPFGAAIVTDEVAGVFAGKDNYLRHVFTATGHPVCSAAALKNIEIIEEERLVENAAETGAYLKAQLETLMADHPTVGDVRGLGLMCAIELVSDRKTKEPFAPDLGIDSRVREKLRSRGVLLGSTDGVIVLGTPLVITRSDVDDIVHAIDLTLWELEGELGIVSSI